MNWYREVYLKSEDWKSLRAVRLHMADYKCELCKQAKPSLDVHHLRYKRLHDVLPEDLRALCRDCHDFSHELMARYVKLKSLGCKAQWKIIRAHWDRAHPPVKKIKQRVWSTDKAFGICRDVLVSMRLVKRNRMVFTESARKLRSHLPNPISFLKEYIKATGIDPRYRTDRIGPHKLLTCPFCPQ